MNEKRYSIRPLGGTAWGEASTLEEARKIWREASDRLSARVLIVDNETGEEVDPDPAEE